jgi:transcriptional regulator with PAS, ATPase and Fis domain
VNSAALPETLLESELFGHLRGAFTGAVSDRAGRFELAHRGTLFLDEIGDLPLALQAKLLRVLQDRCVERLGSGKPVPVDIRVIAATNRDLRQMIANQQFREDLYYRLAVIPVEVPPLRDRREDIPALIESILAKLAVRGLPVAAGVSSSAMAALTDHAWPGNVRELENALEYASIRAGAQSIEPAHLPPSIHHLRTSSRAANHSITECSRIRAALRDSSSAAEAAARLGISRATLFRRMKTFDLRVSGRESQSSHH